MEKKAMRRADLITSVVLLIYSIGMFVMSVNLVLKTLSKGRMWYQSAGLFPTIVATFTFLCAISLMRTAFKDGADFSFLTMDNAKKLIKSKEFKVSFIIIGLLAMYIFILLPITWLRYEFSTFIFLFTFMIIFNKKDIKSIIKTIVICIIATGMLTYGFGQLAMIPLP
ncbi:hypothetical protein QE109_07970 [Fusibacter bizertensis]|uniref:Tripartite tricarboxylate transporter TctB family protein n=1 Tax=Fusibacter bizertensis TaxID=1488331 RepID=A0ABT6NCD3_9FIRM|nr:hypothetical protein [Fusibacter bizertensis]MDH8678080.1 hypothetical protein [Fusibacter bizertensis]